MSRIFGSAHFTTAWLGPKDHSLAFEAIKAIADIQDKNMPSARPPSRPSFNLDWLQHHPQLFPDGPELTNNYLNDPWSAVADLLQHQYWKRVWILQEVVLADPLVLISPGGAMLDWSILRETAQTFFLLARKLERENRRPDFLSDSAWKLLSDPMAWGRLSLLLAAQARNKIPDPDGIKGWAVSCFAANLQATNERDYIYGLLGVSGIQITPDYSPENKASHVYTKYIAGWLNAARNQRTAHIHTPLAFLFLAGIAKHGYSDLPSWVPNYAKGETVVTPWCYGASDFHSAFRSSLPADTNTYPYVVEATQSLFTWGVDLGAVGSTTNPSDSDSAVLSSFMSLATSFTARYPQYISGIPSAQAILKLISMNRQGKVSRELVDSAMNLTLCINCFNTFEDQPVKKTRGRDWDYGLFDMAFPTTDLKQFGFGPNLIAEINSWDRTRRTEALLDIMPPLYDRRFFGTSDVYLGSAKFQVMEGDRLCILSGYMEPVILRPTAEGSLVFVGTAFAVDMDIENTLQKMKSQGQWFELW